MKLTNRSPRLVGAVAALALACASLTACATSNKASSGSASQGVTDKTIKIGGVVTKTSPTGYSTADADLGAKARFARADAEGGVNGRTIDYVGSEDDGMVVANGLTAAKKLVQQDNVFAVVPVDAPEFGGATFLQQQGVPFFGWAVGPNWCGTKVAFGYNGCLAPTPGAGTQTWWGNQIAQQIGGAQGKAVFVQGTDDSASKYGVGTISQSFTAAGFALAGSSAAIATASAPTDYLPYVNKIMKSNHGKAPDVVVSIMASPVVNAGLYSALRKAGYKGALTDAVSYDPNLLKNAQLAAGLNGVYAAPQFEPFESDSPQVAQLKADIEKVKPGTTTFTTAMAVGYWSADIFIAMAKKAGKDLTRTSFLAAANGFSYDNAGFGKIDFPADQTESNGCGALVKLDGTTFTVAQHLKCYPNTPLK